MFKKEHKIKAISSVRSSDRRKIINEIQKFYNVELSEQQIEATVSKDLKTTRFFTYSDRQGFFYYSNDEPSWIKMDELLIPTVYTAWKLPYLLPKIYTNGFVIKKLIGGAELMIPGIFFPDEGLPIASKNSPVSICVYNDPNAFTYAIGLLTMDTKNIKEDDKGVAVQIVHTIDDYLWKQGSKIEPQDVIIPSEINNNVAQQDDTLEKIEDQKLNEDQRNNEIEGNGDKEHEAKENEEKGDETKEDEKKNSEIKEDEEDEDKNKEDKLSVEEVDQSLMNALFQSMSTNFNREVSKDLLPIPISTFYSNYLLRARMKDSTVEVKHSSFKKLQKFMKFIEKKRIIQLKEIQNNLTIKSVNYDHEEFKNYTPLKKGKTQVNVTSNSKEVGETSDSADQPKIECIKLLKLNPTANLLLKLSEDVVFVTRNEVELKLIKYFKSNQLFDRNRKGYVKLDNNLKVNLKLNENESYCLVKEDIIEKIIGKMDNYYSLKLANREAKIEKGKPTTINIKLQKRCGNKVVTLLTNFEFFELDADDLIKKFTNLCASSVSANILPTKKKMVLKELLIQGPQQSILKDYFNQLGISDEFIHIEELKKKKK
ncbi:hypothetical protein K502DRAFT_342656 [Neoconidiobolus thromboides FSU 785]|nr:hypothetical protein K502DRAFT_342656 [Neoconidiobolus thromboides FSU 785]